jgi:hypothetical protein
MTTVTSNGHLFTANQGDADQREENREAQNQRAIHLESSKVTQVPETSSNTCRPRETPASTTAKGGAKH